VTLFSLVEGKKPVVYCVSGHGESDIEDMQKPMGLNQAAMILRGDGYEVRSLPFMGGETTVPDDADIVVLAAPVAPLSNQDVHALRSYAEQGGKLLIMPSMHFDSGSTKPMDMNLGPLLEHFGVEVRDFLLVEDENRGMRDFVNILRVTRYDKKHPAVQAMGGGEDRPTGFASVRMVRPKSKHAVPVVFSTSTTIEKGDIAEIWDKTQYNKLLKYGQSLFNPEKDTRGPFPLIVASEVPGKRPELTARAVVAGSHSFCANMGLATAPYNKDLLLNLTNWLTERESHMGIAAKSPREVSYKVRPKTRTKVFLLVLIFIPLTALAAGGMVWFNRRK
jgi:ABC-type uncharacterized transport system involved in gliding motility auxiliary subunit